eukprot:s1411_g10.t1
MKFATCSACRQHAHFGGCHSWAGKRQQNSDFEWVSHGEIPRLSLTAQWMEGSWEAISDDVLRETDVAYEQELQQNPYSVKLWCAYVKAKAEASLKVRFLIYERAVKELPGSYKLWHAYLQLRMQSVKDSAILDPEYEACNNAFERALVFLHKMPRIWLHYIEFLMKQKKITRARRALDRALRSLPITQHSRIWELYVKFIKDGEVPKETALCAFRRYLMLEPDHVEIYIAYLRTIGRYDEAAQKLANVVDDEDFSSMEGKTRHQLWMDLCDLVSKHPADIKALNIESIIRSGIRQFTDEVGRLWISLGDHFIRLGQFEKARDIYEEAMATVSTVHDFSLIFESYAKFLESLISAHMEREASAVSAAEADLLMLRLEDLLGRRPELVSSVKLRQNPHNVHEWLQRAKLYKVAGHFHRNACDLDVEAGQSVFVDMPLPNMPKVTIFQATLKRRCGHFWLCKNPQTTMVGHAVIQEKDSKFMRETCAGIGGVSTGFQKCGVTTSVYNDCNVPFSEWLRQHGKKVVVGDINDPKVIQQLACCPGMFMSSGVSCQPFSYLGDGRQQHDERSRSFTGTLKAAYLMQIKVLILECTPAAKDSPWVQGILKSFADQTGFHVNQQLLELHTYWISKRTRWWCTVSDPELHISSIPQIPKMPFCPTFLHLFPKMMEMSPEDMEEISLDLYELRHFHGNPFLEKHLMDPYKTLPTATHSWGSQVKGCKCGCRSSGFHESRIQEKGLYGQIVPTGGEVSNGTQTYRRCRHLHPCEIALANGLMPSHVGNMKGKLRLEMAGVGQLASPFQGAWVLANVIKDIHLNCFPLSNFQEPMDVMQRMAIELLSARDQLLGNPNHTPSNKIFEQAIQQWGQSPALPAQVTPSEADGIAEADETAETPCLPQPSVHHSMHPPVYSHPMSPEENRTSEVGDTKVPTLQTAPNQTACPADVDLGTCHVQKMDMISHELETPALSSGHFEEQHKLHDPMPPLRSKSATGELCSRPNQSDRSVYSADHIDSIRTSEAPVYRPPRNDASESSQKPTVESPSHDHVMCPPAAIWSSDMHLSMHSNPSDSWSKKIAIKSMPNCAEIPNQRSPDQTLPLALTPLGSESLNGGKETINSHRMGRQNPLLEDQEQHSKLAKQPGTGTPEPEKMTQQPGTRTREPEKIMMKQPGSRTPEPATPQAKETRELHQPMFFQAMPTEALDPAAPHPAPMYEARDALLQGSKPNHVPHSTSDQATNLAMRPPGEHDTSKSRMPTHVDPLTGGFQAFANTNKGLKRSSPAALVNPPELKQPRLMTCAADNAPSGMNASPLAQGPLPGEPDSKPSTADAAVSHNNPDSMNSPQTGVYETPSEEEVEKQILAQLECQQSTSTSAPTQADPDDHSKHDLSDPCQVKMSHTVYVSVKGEAIFSHEVHPNCTASQLACAEAEMKMLHQPIRISNMMGVQVPLQTKLHDGQFILLEEMCTVETFRCPLRTSGVSKPSLIGYTREQALWQQQGWVAKDEMEFYLHMLESYQPSSTIGVVELPANGERDAIMTHHLIQALTLAHNHVNCNCKVLVFLHDDHWTPCVAEARGDQAVIHVPVDAYKMTLGGFTGQVGDHEVHFAMHRMPHAFPADCGFQAVGWILSRLLDEETDHPFTVEQASQWRYLFQQNLTYTGYAKQIILAAPRLGGMNNIKDKLQDLVISHGVHPERGSECADQLLSALGTKVIQQILMSPKPWADLKSRASLHKPPIRVVLADELQQQILKRSKESRPVGKKENKMKNAKSAKPMIRLTADQLIIPPAVFRQDDGQEIQQVQANQVGPSSQGVVLANIEEAIPYFGLQAPVSQQGIAILILDHDDNRVPPTCPIIKVPAKCVATDEPMIVSTAVLQIGTKTIERNLPKQCLEVHEVSNTVVRVQVYKDQYTADWTEFVQKPVKTLTAMHPFTELPGNAILDVWDRQFMTMRLSKVPYQEAQLFMVNMRIDASAIETLLRANGEDGKYFELRSHNGRQPDDTYKIVWLPGKAYADAQVVQRASTIPTALVRQGDRYGLRTPDQHAEMLHKQHRPDLVYIHGAELKRYRVGPMPFGSTKQSLVNIFQKWNWQARPIGPHKQADDRSGIMWHVQAADEPSHWIFQLAHGDVLITPETKGNTTETTKPTIFASNKTISSLQAKTKDVVRDDPWLHNDPWKSPNPTKELSVGQVAAIQDKVMHNVMEKLKSNQGEDDEMNGNHDNRLTVLENKFEQLSTQLQQQQQDHSKQQHQVQQQIQGLDRKIDQQQQIYHTALDSKLEMQMQRIEQLFASQQPKPIPWDEVTADSVQSKYVAPSMSSDQHADFLALCASVETAVDAAMQSKEHSLPDASKGRAKTMEVRWRQEYSSPPKASRESEYQPTYHGVNIQHARWLRQYRRLLNLTRMDPTKSGHAYVHRNQLWQSIRDAAGFMPDFPEWWVQSAKQAPLPVQVPEKSMVVQVCSEFHKHLQAFEKALNQQRVSVAKQRRLDDPMVIFKDLKQPPPQPVSMLIDKQDAVVTHVDVDDCSIEVNKEHAWDESLPLQLPTKQVAVIHATPDKLWLDQIDAVQVGDRISQEEYIGDLATLFDRFGQEWTKRWDRHLHTDPQRWDPVVSFAHQVLPVPPPMEYKPLTVQDLDEAIKRKSKKAATGPDGLSRADLLRWPYLAKELLVDLFNKIEQGQPWPRQMITGFVVALEKTPNASAVGQYRPITLFFVIVFGALSEPDRFSFTCNRMHPAPALGTCPEDTLPKSGTE